MKVFYHVLPRLNTRPIASSSKCPSAVYGILLASKVNAYINRYLGTGTVGTAVVLHSVFEDQVML